MFLYLTRHGETQWNRLGKTQGSRDICLNDLGRTQGKMLGQRLKRSNTIDSIYCSDLSRARETAETIGDMLNIIPNCNALLREVSFGDWEGLTIAEIEELYPGALDRWRNDPSFSPKYGESLLDVHDRIRSFIRMLEINHPDSDENILVVSHATTTKMLILSLMGIPLNLITGFKINQASLSLLKVNGSNNSIIYLNDTHHLDAV